MKVLAEKQDKTTEAQNELNYIMTLTAAQREALRLEMPLSLRKKIRDSKDGSN